MINLKVLSVVPVLAYVSSFCSCPFVASVLSFKRNLVVAYYLKRDDEIPPE
jgi:hypothetical protein